MRHVFILNPVAGKNQSALALKDKIIAYFTAHPELEYSVRLTDGVGAATRIAREECENGHVRLYACGGDGTLQETAAGIPVGRTDVELTVIPCGSGNDFVRIFSDPSRFHDLASLTQGPETRFDLIQCGDRYSINICSMGLDARIGTQMAAYKALPGVSGMGAYLASTAVNVIKGIHEPYTIEVNGQTLQGNYTMICICSGSYYGGGFNPVPEAKPDDGMLDVLLVSKVSRLQVAKLIGAYKAGRYAEFPDLIAHYHTTEITIHCEKETVINLDGESLYGTDVTFRIVPRTIRFFYPEGVHYRGAEA